MVCFTRLTGKKGHMGAVAMARPGKGREGDEGKERAWDWTSDCKAFPGFWFGFIIRHTMRSLSQPVFFFFLSNNAWLIRWLGCVSVLCFVTMLLCVIIERGGERGRSKFFWLESIMYTVSIFLLFDQTTDVAEMCVGGGCRLDDRGGPC